MYFSAIENQRDPQPQKKDARRIISFKFGTQQTRLSIDARRDLLLHTPAASPYVHITGGARVWFVGRERARWGGALHSPKMNPIKKN